jgi:predicted molibdopterin-dependent oxidoreductase YjgC
VTAFRRIDAGPPVRFVVDGRPLEARAGDSVATALLAAGFSSFGPHPKTGEPAAPWCLIGQCFGCLCTIDGRAGSQACLVPVAEGMRVETGRGG